MLLWLWEDPAPQTARVSVDCGWGWGPSMPLPESMRRPFFLRRRATVFMKIFKSLCDTHAKKRLRAPISCPWPGAGDRRTPFLKPAGPCRRQSGSSAVPLCVVIPTPCVGCGRRRPSVHLTLPMGEVGCSRGRRNPARAAEPTSETRPAVGEGCAPLPRAPGPDTHLQARPLAVVSRPIPPT